MQIVIEIDDKLYKRIKYLEPRADTMLDELMRSVQNGTPLPKGHGRLVDISKIDKDRIESDNPVIYLTMNGEYTEAISLSYLDNLPTIIEANDAESEEKE